MVSTEDDRFGSNDEFEKWKTELENTAPNARCIWPKGYAPEEPDFCFDELHKVAFRHNGKLYYIMGHRDCPKKHVMEEDEMDNNGQSCTDDPESGFASCPRMPLTTGNKIRYCKGGPSNDDRYGLVKLSGMEKLATRENAYNISIEDMLIRCVAFQALCAPANVISSIDTEAEVMKGHDKSYPEAMEDYLKNTFPNEKLGALSEADWRRAPGLFRLPMCDYHTYRWNYENWNLSKKPSEDPRCARFPCCPGAPPPPPPEEAPPPPPPKPPKPEKPKGTPHPEKPRPTGSTHRKEPPRRRGMS